MFKKILSSLISLGIILGSNFINTTYASAAPTISGTPDNIVNEGEAYSFIPTATDTDTEMLSFGIKYKPIWATFNETTGELSGTPGHLTHGSYFGIEINVSDGDTIAYLPQFWIYVEDQNLAPTISGTPVTSVNEGEAYSFIPTASDPEGEIIKFGIENKPDWASFDIDTGELSGTPGHLTDGTYFGIIINVSDGNTLVELPLFDLTVGNFNQNPIISGTPATSVLEGESYSFTPTASDPDGDTLTFSGTNLPVWASFDTTNGSITGTPGLNDSGINSNIIITANDINGGSASLSYFSIDVGNTNQGPGILGSPQTTIIEDQSYYFKPTASDPDDGDELTFSIANLPSWASFNTTNGELTGIPGDQDVGQMFSNISISVSDGSESATLSSFIITVTNANSIPSISGTPSTSVNEGEAYSFTPTASDPDTGDELTFSISNKPEWASFDTTNGVLTGTPGSQYAGQTFSSISISVSDGVVSAAIPLFNISVVDLTEAPSISGTPDTSVNEEEAYSFTPTASDPDGDTLTFSINDLPIWASFDTTNGAITGTPGSQYAGITYQNIVISVNDGTYTVSLNPYNLTVVDITAAPLISGTPATSVLEGEAYSFIPTATDVDGDVLTFSGTNLPEWASFDIDTGELSGTPGYDDQGTFFNVTIIVSDGTYEDNMSFNILVEDYNRAPTITGTPNTSVDEGQEYLFIPGANDDDEGEIIAFGIINKPNWATFSETTGELSGTPGYLNQGTYTGIIINVSDGNTIASLAAFDLVVNNINQNPVISGDPATSGAEEEAYSFTPTASDVDEDPLTFSIENLPEWASFDTTNGSITGTPSLDQMDVYADIIITVNDDNGGSASLASFSIDIGNTNQGPSILGSPQTTINEGETYYFKPTASDPDTGDELTFSIENQPEWASFDTTNGELTGTPGSQYAGQMFENISITVVDDGLESAGLTPFIITVIDITAAPVISGTPSTSVNEGEAYSFIPTATDVDGDVLTFSGTNLPEWASLDIDTGELSGTPGYNDQGTFFNVTITVSDGTYEDSMSFNIIVENYNRTPTITGTPNTSVDEGQEYLFIPGANDDDGETLGFGIINKPDWATFSETTGELSGTPGYLNQGTYTGIIINVSDGNTIASLAAFDLVVNNVNQNPVISGNPATSGAEGEAYSFIPTASDPDEDTLTFSGTNIPEWASFNTTNGAITGTPSLDQMDVYADIIITVSDDNGGSASLASFSIDIGNTNQGPSIACSPQTIINEGETYYFKPTASDPDTGDVLTYEITNTPSWASFNTENGELTGTPGSDDGGIAYEGITIKVIDGEQEAASCDPFIITVIDVTVVSVNNAPTISGTAATTVEVGTLYSFTPTANDIDDGDILTFSISNKPSWASFNTSDGTLSGTPQDGDEDTYREITISVSDNTDLVSLDAFDIEVTNGSGTGSESNNAPTIGGTPDALIGVGQEYSFTPTGSDEDGDDLTYSILNQPSWLDFETNRGTLSGTPADGDIGTYTGIVISVSDGTGSANLPMFSIQVIEATELTISASYEDTTIGITSGESMSLVVTSNASVAGVYSIENQPSWTSFDTSDGSLSGTPQDSNVGTYSGIVIKVTDGGLSAEILPFAIEVSPIHVNTAPTISGTPSTSVGVGQGYSFTPTGFDADGDTLTYSGTNLPSWLSINTSNGNISGTPESGDLGSHTNIIITVSDGEYSASLSAFSIEVTEEATLSISATYENTTIGVVVGETMSLVVTSNASDAGVYSIENQPSWTSFNSSDGSLSGTPGDTNTGTYANIIIKITDGGVSAEILPFIINVTDSDSGLPEDDDNDTFVLGDGSFGGGGGGYRWWKKYLPGDTLPEGLSEEETEEIVAEMGIAGVLKIDSQIKSNNDEGYGFAGDIRHAKKIESTGVQQMAFQTTISNTSQDSIKDIKIKREMLSDSNCIDSRFLSSDTNYNKKTETFTISEIKAGENYDFSYKILASPKGDDTCYAVERFAITDSSLGLDSYEHINNNFVNFIQLGPDVSYEQGGFSVGINTLTNLIESGDDSVVKAVITNDTGNDIKDVQFKFRYLPAKIKIISAIGAIHTYGTLTWEKEFVKAGEVTTIFFKAKLK